MRGITRGLKVGVWVWQFWPSIVDPDLFDTFAPASLGGKSLSVFGHGLQLRLELYERGVTGPGEENRKGPKVTLSKQEKRTADKVAVTLSVKAVEKSSRTVKRIEWDVDRDGRTDATGEKVTRTYKAGEVQQVVVVVTDSKGWITSKDAVIAAE